MISPLLPQFSSASRFNSLRRCHSPSPFLSLSLSLCLFLSSPSLRFPPYCPPPSRSLLPSFHLFNRSGNMLKRPFANRQRVMEMAIARVVDSSTKRGRHAPPLPPSLPPFLLLPPSPLSVNRADFKHKQSKDAIELIAPATRAIYRRQPQRQHPA